MVRRAEAVLFAIAVSAPSVARADPQWNAATLLGVAGTGTHAVWSATQFYGALRADVLFGRTRDADVSVGPALELGTAGFRDARALAGATVLLPLGATFALGVTPGAYVRSSQEGAFAGLSARGFLGIRSYNFQGKYGLSGGVVVGVDRDVGGAGAHAVVVAAQLDGELLALPVIWLVAWLRGPRS